MSTPIYSRDCPRDCICPDCQTIRRIAGEINQVHKIDGYLMVPYPTGYDWGLSEDVCDDLVDLDWVNWLSSKISYWHPYVFNHRS